MNENSTPGEVPSSDRPHPDAAQPASPQEGQVPGGHALPGAFGSHTPAWPAPGQPGPPRPDAARPQHAPQPGQEHAGAAFGAYGTVPQPPHRPTEPTVPLDPALLAAPTATEAEPRKTGRPVKVAALLLAAALVGGVSGFGGSAIGNAVFAGPVASDGSGPQTVTVNNPGSVNETTAIATEVLPSVVTLEVAGAEESGSGSGVILSEDGYVLTNTHVVTLGGAASDPAIRVTTSDGRIYQATIVGTDPVYDLAVIKLRGAEDLTPIEFADSSKLNVGSTAVAVGAPLGLANSVTTGIVSALNRSIQIASSAAPDSPADQPEGEDPQEGGPFQFDIPGMGSQQARQSISISVIQTDAAINPGNSGGALVDSEGKLIGINVAIATAGGTSSGESGSIGLGFAIPSNIAKRIADELIEDGTATHGLLGASVRDAGAVEDAEVAGAYIAEVTAGGAAADASLRQGDIITEFEGLPITGASDLTAQVRALAAGSDAKVTYVRDGKEYEVEVTLGELKL
ncbi:S1C family serine protease [Microbacterium sp.]|uniref:S1C family serine protease n=1 Tax=Microbacterium sp. TaxID=51671 RepID=UPI002810AEEF|nr:trypsin-like peptidase domain-containing protein [Microbacterium sp.]